MRTRTQGIGAILPAIVLIALIGVSPFFNALWNSFFQGLWEDRTFVGLANYRYITGDRGFGYSLNITVLWSVLSALLSIAIGFLLALRLASPRRGSSALFRTLLVPWGIPIFIAVPLWRAFIHGNGGVSVLSRLTGLTVNLMIDPVAGFLGALVVSLWMNIPLAAFVLSAHMRQIPRQVVEAAAIDGASEGQIARFIYLPAIAPSIIAVGIRNLIGAFKEFTLVYLMTAGGPPLIQGITERHIIGATTTLGVFLYEVFLGSGDWGITSAYAMIMSLLVIGAMALWGLSRGSGNPQRRALVLLVLTALAQIPGGTPLLWGIAAAYLASMRFPRYRPALLAVHLTYLLVRIVVEGFLAGFHPGVIVAVVAMVVLYRRGREIPPPPSSWRSRRSRVGTGHVLTIGSASAAAVMTVATTAILYLLVWMSLSRVSAVYIDTVLPSHPTISNFIRAFREEGVLRNFGNTAIIAIATTFFVPIVLFPAAVRLHNRGRRRVVLALAIVQILEMAGGMHSLIPLYRIFIALRLVDTFVPLILIYLYHAIPFSLFVLTAYLSTVPPSLRDIATIEGMSFSAYAYRVLMPLSLPAIGTAVMAAFIGAWNGFLPALLFLNREELYPISMKLHEWVGSLASGTPVWNLFAATSLANMVLVGFLLLRFKNPMRISPLMELSE